MKIGNLEIYGVIYKITNKINDKVYIGQTTRGFEGRYPYKGVGIERVYKFHKNALKRNKQSCNEYLLKSIEKYGFNTFEVVEIFDFAFSKVELDTKEICYIKSFNCISNGYNTCEGGYYTPKMIGENNPNSKKVYCLTNNKLYSNAHEAERELGIHNDNIRGVCCGKSNRCFDINNNVYTFCWYEEYLDMAEDEKNHKLYKSTDEYRKEILSKSHIGQVCQTRRMVICLNTNEVFESVTEAMNHYRLSGLWSCLSGKTKTCGKNPITGERLKWAYYD